MLNMKILDYRITSDSNQVIVNKVRRTETGEIAMVVDKKTNEQSESQSLVGYYGNLSRALVAIQRDYVYTGKEDIQSIKDYRQALETITSKLENDLLIKEGTKCSE